MFKIDILVEDEIILELKAVEEMKPVFENRKMTEKARIFARIAGLNKCSIL